MMEVVSENAQSHRTKPKPFRTSKAPTPYTTWRTPQTNQASGFFGWAYNLKPITHRTNGKRRIPILENRTGAGAVRELIFCLTFKMSHDRGWREPCCSEHGS